MNDDSPHRESIVPAEFLRQFLADNDIECPQCQYNLRNLTGDRCPECGEQIVLRVQLSEPKQGLLIAGLIGLSAGAGLSGLLLIYVLIQWLRNKWSNSGEPFLTTVTAGVVVEGLAIVFWLRYWRRIRRLSPKKRIFLVTLCILLTLMNIVYFSFTIR